MTPDKYSEHNLANTLAVFLAGKLLAAGYAVYWHESDALQLGANWYYDYSVNQATLLATGPFAAEFAAAKAMVTLLGRPTANPRYVTRLPSDGTVREQDVIPMPALTLRISPAVPVGSLELGTRVQWRIRGLDIDGACRTAVEQSQMADLLAMWFDACTSIDIIDHAAGQATVVGSIEIKNPMAELFDAAVTEPDVARYEIALSAQLEYAA